jgi:hypothetical protein
MTKLLAHVCLLVQFMLFFVAFYICQLSHRLCYCFCSALKEEKIAARTALVPVLQAEEDERFVKEWTKSLMWEEIIMKDVPGWKVGQSVYNSGKWMPPATGELRRED